MLSRMTNFHHQLISSFSVAFTLAIVGLPTGCKPPAKTEKPAEQKDAPKADAPKSSTGPVARVNGVDIPRDSFKVQLERTQARFKRAGREVSPQLETRLKENLIRKMIDDELISQKAKSEKITVSAEELGNKLTEHKNRFGKDEKAFQSFLQRTNQSEADVKRDLERNLLRDKLFSKLMEGGEPTEDDAKAYYEKNRDKYTQKEQVQASHILLKVAKDAPAKDKKAKMKLAKSLVKKAKKKNADFAALAREHSEGPTKSRGGDLGKFSRGRMVKAFEEAAFTAKAGSVVGPVETQFGYHVIKVMEKFPARERTFEEVSDSVLTSLKARKKSKATRETLAALKKEAKIEVLEEGIDLVRSRPKPPGPGGKGPLSPEQIKRLQQKGKSGVPLPPGHPKPPKAGGKNAPQGQAK